MIIQEQFIINQEKEKKYLVKRKNIFRKYNYDDDEIKQLLFLNIPYWLGKTYEPFIKNGNNVTKYLAGILLRIEPVSNYLISINRYIEFDFF